MMHPKIKQTNYYGFDHNKVNEKFEGNLTYCNTFCVKDEYQPVAVYKAKSPNKSKGHKKYMLLQTMGGLDGSSGGARGLVRGMTPNEMKKWRYQEAIHCLGCNTIVYSVNRHHMSYCDCANEAFADGGRDYLRAGAMDISKTRTVVLDLITNKVIENFSKKFKKVINGK